MLTIYHGSGKSRTFHPSEAAAEKAKKVAVRLQKREGSRAFTYSREAQVEYEEAKKLIGDVRLATIAREYAVRSAAGAERKSVTEAVEHYIKTKIKLGRSYKHVSDLKDRLRTFAASFPDRGLESITRNELLDWLLALQPAQSSRSVWNFFGALAALFRYAEKRDWLVVNPITKIDPKSDLPKKTKGAVEILTVKQGKAVMRKIEETEPRFIAWACIQYFLGIRASESDRFRGEWIRPAEKKIVVPGWHLEGKTKEPVSKTRDDWVIHGAPAAFWRWVKRYPKSFRAGRLAHPRWEPWGELRDSLIKDKVFKKWPRNGFRASAATMHLSAYSDPGRTSLLLRHRNPERLHANYLAEIQDEEVGLEYLNLSPR